MRHALLLGLILLICASAVGLTFLVAGKPAGPPRRVVDAAVRIAAPTVADAAVRLHAPAAAVEAIPQDAARMAKRLRERLDWNRLTLRVAYDKVGKKDARWDKPAREALEFAARMFSRQLEMAASEGDIQDAAGTAINAGCDDPIILYMFTLRPVGQYTPEEDEEYARRIEAAANAMSRSVYSPIRRAEALSAAAEALASRMDLAPEEKGRVERGVDEVLDLLAKSVSDDARNVDWEDRWLKNIQSAIAAKRKLDGDFKAAFDRVEVRLAKIKGIEVLRLTVEGDFYLKWGWEARSNAYANEVGEDQFRLFETRLQHARDALYDAWKAKPDEPHVAELMMGVEKGIGGGDRQALETWFLRAMRVDGYDNSACWQKLDWLDPKWHGGRSPAEMMAFGKACGATKNWRTAISLLAAEAHLRYFFMLGPADRMPYMASPEVWSEIKTVYEQYLEHLPFKDVQRGKYAILCYLCGRFPEAYAQFRILGDRMEIWPDFPNLPLSTMIQFRNEVAWKVTGKPF